jgi:hypothetical protein
MCCPVILKFQRVRFRLSSTVLSLIPSAGMTKLQVISGTIPVQRNDISVARNTIPAQRNELSERGNIVPLRGKAPSFGSPSETFEFVKQFNAGDEESGKWVTLGSPVRQHRKSRKSMTSQKRA